MKKRIWELDTLRGICLWGMIAVHLVYDLVELTGLVHWDTPAAFNALQRWGGVLFLLISGISATLGSRSVRRGVIVFSCGMLVSAVTYGMYRLQLADKGILIYFGVLHCLGCCMILWALCKRMPTWLLALLGAAMIAGGFILGGMAPVDYPWLMPLGLTYRGFVSSDYFPLVMNFGFFLLGAVLGRTVYGKKESILPPRWRHNRFNHFFGFCGRHSLEIYLLHQPLLAGVCYAIAMLK